MRYESRKTKEIKGKIARIQDTVLSNSLPEISRSCFGNIIL